jgi:hypothetical protein
MLLRAGKAHGTYHEIIHDALGVLHHNVRLVIILSTLVFQLRWGELFCFGRSVRLEIKKLGGVPVRTLDALTSLSTSVTSGSC